MLVSNVIYLADEKKILTILKGIYNPLQVLFTGVTEMQQNEKLVTNVLDAIQKMCQSD